MRRAIIAALICAFVGGCAGYNDKDMPPHVQSVWRGQQTNVAVYFVTDRGERTDPPRMGGRGENWGGAACGLLPVDVPSAGAVQVVDKHQMRWATIGTAAYTIPACDPPEPDQKADASSPLEKFVHRMATEAPLAAHRCVLLYIHGYNTTFDSAITRAAQLAFDTQHSCIPLAFSWSSAGQLDRYVSDVEHSSYAVPLLRALLVALKAEGLRVDIVAHSMGTRLTMQTLVTMRRECVKQPPVDELVLAAPDIGEEQDNDDFAQLTNYASGCAKRTTLYVSLNDSVLAASQSIHGGIARAGRDLPQTVLHQSAYPVGGATPHHPIDVIDADWAPGDPMGHGYFAVSYEMISDIALVLADVPVLTRTRPENGYGATLGCGPDADQACDPGAPRFKLIVGKARRLQPDRLMRFLQSLIPLRSPGG